MQPAWVHHGKKSVRNHRRRPKERGFRRVEVTATESDAALIRRLAKVLRSGGEMANEARQRLTEMFAGTRNSLKKLLASAPLEGIHITRSRDPRRSVDL